VEGERLLRIRVKLYPEEHDELVLPLHYNHAVQGFVYSNLDAGLARWVHDEGHAYFRRNFKMFTFARLGGRYRIHQGRISFLEGVTIRIAAVDADLLASIAEHLLKRPQVRLGNEVCRVDEVAVEPKPEVGQEDRLVVRAASPITVYSTLTTIRGSRKTYYYSPYEDEWSQGIISNLARKAKSLCWQTDPERDLEGSYLKPLRVTTRDMSVVNYKGNIIKGWLGIYELRLPEPYFWLAYDAGLGAKNAQGFGMFDVLRPKPHGGSGASELSIPRP